MHLNRQVDRSNRLYTNGKFRLSSQNCCTISKVEIQLTSAIPFESLSQHSFALIIVAQTKQQLGEILAQKALLTTAQRGLEIVDCLEMIAIPSPQLLPLHIDAIEYRLGQFSAPTDDLSDCVSSPPHRHRSRAPVPECSCKRRRGAQRLAAMDCARAVVYNIECRTIIRIQASPTCT